MNLPINIYLIWSLKFSLYYDSNYLMIDSFEYEVLKNNLIHMKCIEKGNAPASSYHGAISWYNKFNVAGCNVTKVTIGFKAYLSGNRPVKYYRDFIFA